jgi:hypothetical protein
MSNIQKMKQDILDMLAKSEDFKSDIEVYLFLEELISTYIGMVSESTTIWGRKR